MKLTGRALATGAIWLTCDHTRTIIASDILRALAATVLVIVGSVQVVMIHAGVMGYQRVRGG